MKKITLLSLFAMGMSIAQSTTGFKVHSHNDYLQNVPFWKAYSAGATSIEADVFLVGDSLYVAHTKNNIDSRRSLGSLYLGPLKKTFALDFGHPTSIQLLIDIKSDPYATLDAIINTLKKYPTLISNKKISFVISGNQPKPEEYINYPDYILFDYQNLNSISETAILDKIGLISLDFQKFSHWNGEGKLSIEDTQKITSIIKKAHGFGKPFRFWATPDSPVAWKTFMGLGIDFINTDMPFKCVDYLTTMKTR